MIITLGNVRAHISQATDAEHAWLSDYLSWPDDKGWIRRRMGYKSSGYIRLYNRVDDSYPAGFTRSIAEAARKAGHSVQVADGRIKPAIPGPWPSYLRPYQLDACDSAAKRSRGVVWAATGAGKTQIAMGLIESIPCRWLFLVPQTQLGLQARDRYKTFCGDEAGVIAEGTWSPHLDPTGLTVATFQMLYARLKRNPGDPQRLDVERFLQSIQGVIVDECHVLPADSFKKVVDELTNAYYRIGLSATPLQRGDRKSMHLIGCLGSVVYRISAGQLIQAGTLAKPNIKMLPLHQESEKKTWQGAYNELIANSVKRNQMACDLAAQAQKPCIVFVKALKQGEWIKKRLTKMGQRVEYIDGSTDTPVRQAVVTRLERGDTDIVVATVVLNQGIDVPELRSIVMAAGGASTIAALQRVGRGMRVVPGKTEFDVYDFWDTGNRWTEKHSKERLRSYKVEDYDVEVPRDSDD